MPAGDGTGPAGRGPMTGRGLGPCAENTPLQPGGGCPFWGRGNRAGWGAGRGMGRGMGFRNRPMDGRGQQ